MKESEKNMAYSNEFQRSLNVMLDAKFDDLSHEKPNLWGDLVQSVIRIALSKGFHLEKNPAIIRQLSKLEKMGVVPIHLYADVADTMIRQYQLTERAGRSN